MRIASALAFCAVLMTTSGLRVTADPSEHTSTLADQKRVNVTIYNGDLSLIHDRRHVTLSKGENPLAWRDVSAHLDGTSVLVESITRPDAVTVLEQNFDFDLLRPSALLDKAVGQEVTIVRDHPFPGQAARERARLLSTNEGIILQYADRIETSLDNGYIVYTSLPPNLRDRPTLVLDLESKLDGPQDVELSYLTSGLGWHAEYVGQVSPNDDRVDLNGLVTLTNTSGASYRNAHVQLVAGNVHVPPPPSPAQLRTIARVSDTYAAQQENFFEYHLYTLPRPTTIEENQTKQVGFMSAHNVPIHETLELRGSAYYYRGSNADLGAKLPVSAYLSFENKGGELGVPLPGGLVRLYKTDSRGISQFLGADRIDHTPRNETVRLHVGESFDVTARKKQTNFHIVSSDPAIIESSYEITLGNAKDQAVDVLVVEPIPSDWEMLSESAPHTKSSSGTASWTVHVPPNEHVTLTYSVRVRFF